MTDKKKFDSEAGHEHYSKTCFNGAWGLIEKENRSTKEDEELIHTTHASLYHWLQREDCSAQNLSIGYWQLSRVYALVDEAENAIKYGDLCLDNSRKEDVASVYLGYAYETLARTHGLAEDKQKKEEYKKKAKQIAEGLPSDDKAQLQGDLDTIS